MNKMHIQTDNIVELINGINKCILESKIEFLTNFYIDLWSEQQKFFNHDEIAKLRKS